MRISSSNYGLLNLLMNLYSLSSGDTLENGIQFKRVAKKIVAELHKRKHGSISIYLYELVWSMKTKRYIPVQ